MTVDQLLSHILADPSHLLRQRIENWICASSRFRAFAETYHGKIRKKIRDAGDNQAVEDIAFELQTAYLLLHERRFELEYEPRFANRTRSPDFTVTFKTHVRLNVEVKRNRVPAREPICVDAPVALTKQHEIAKWIGGVCDKLGQMPPDSANLLVMSAISSDYRVEELHATLARLRLQAENSVDEVFHARGFAGAKDWLRQYRHLSAIMICPDPAATAALPTILWFNSLAKHPLPDDLRAVLRRLIAA